MTPDLPAVLAGRVLLTPSCWLWTGAVQSRGYGSVWIDGRTHLVHRIAWEHAHGPIPGALTVDHIACFSKACCRPSHLRLLTRSENSRLGSLLRWGRCDLAAVA